MQMACNRAAETVALLRDAQHILPDRLDLPDREDRYPVQKDMSLGRKNNPPADLMDKMDTAGCLAHYIQEGKRDTESHPDSLEAERSHKLTEMLQLQQCLMLLKAPFVSFNHSSTRIQRKG
jgi:hypothetical protein